MISDGFIKTQTRIKLFFKTFQVHSKFKTKINRIHLSHFWRKILFVNDRSANSVWSRIETQFHFRRLKIKRYRDRNRTSSVGYILSKIWRNNFGCLESLLDHGRPRLTTIDQKVDMEINELTGVGYLNDGLMVLLAVFIIKRDRKKFQTR